MATTGQSWASPTSTETRTAIAQKSAPDATQPDESLLTQRPQPAKDNDIRFKPISIEQGLSQSVVLCILQDSLGFMWVCTQDGLNRYDGYEFKIYKHDPADGNSTSDNLIQALYEGKDGALWIGTNAGGLDRYDLVTGQFRHYQNNPNDPASLSANDITAIYEDPSGALWIGTNGGGLDRLDPGAEKFVHHVNDPNDPHSLSGNGVTAIAPGRDGVIWIGTGAGLNRLDPATGQFTRYQNDPSDPSSLNNDAISAIHTDRSGALWVGTNGGLEKFDPQTGRFTHFQNDPAGPHSLCSNIVLSVYQDDAGTVWVGTNNCLDRLEPENEQFTHYRNDPDDPSSLNNNQVQSIYQNRSGVLWFGTFGGGLNLFDRTMARFRFYKNDPRDPDSLSNDFVWSLAQDRQGNVWAGTGGGLEKLNSTTGKFTHYQNDPGDPDSIRPGIVMSIYPDRDDTLWLGLWDGGIGGGLDQFDPIAGKFIHHQTPSVLFITRDRDGVLWTGTINGGLGKLEQGATQFTYYQNNPQDTSSLSNNGVTSVYQDREGSLWLGTFNGGLNRFDPAAERFTRYQNDPQDPHSLSINIVLAIHQDQSGVLWIGTSNGLNRFDAATETFTVYTEKDGLPNNVIYAILEDAQGRLWLSTNRGISRFDPRTATFKNYDMGDGLPSNEFNQSAFLRDKRDNLYFGSIKGFVTFDPDDLQNNDYVPPIVLTAFTQGGETVEPGQTIPTASEITLRWPNNRFEFEFAALSYTQPEKNRYAYVLEGFDENWSPPGTIRFGRYTNIPGGTYRLRIKAANNDGIWSEKSPAITITVVPPFWETWWFRILAGGLVVAVVLGAFRLRVQVIENQRRQLAIQVDEKTRELRDTLAELKQSKEAAEAANRAKSIFLANMSHELRTPLNAILGFTQLMSRDANLTPVQQENMSIINRSGEHLLGLINQVLQLSKIEAGRIALDEQSFNLYHVLDGLEEMFRLRASEKGLELVFERAPDVPQHVWMDEGKLRQVLMNLLSNAIKFTESGGVTLRVQASRPQGKESASLILHIEVEDTGPGIKPDELETVFEPFEQTAIGRKHQEGTGLGLTISQQFMGLMGGELSVTSPVPAPVMAGGGAGSIFSFDVLASSADASAVQSGQPVRRVIGLEPGQPAYRLLIVEDNWANRRLLVQLLTPLGFQVREAANGQEALNIWEHWTPNLIFMDMRMPVVDGYEATRRIRATIRGHAVVIVALTASVLDEERDVILSEGCDAFLRKPFRENDLFDAIAKHLGVRFVYQTETVAPADVPHPKARATESLVTRLAVLHPELVGALQHATVEADLDAIAAAIDRIRAQDGELAGALAKLADNFDHDAILDLIQARSSDAG